MSSTVTDSPRATRLDEILLEHAVHTPDRVALVAARGTFTWSSLAARVQAIAAGLYARGVRQGSVIAIRLPSGADQVAAMVATWRCGAAFIGLPQAWPHPRCAQLFGHCGIEFMVGAGETIAGVTGVSVQSLIASGVGHQAPNSRTGADDLMCVFATSGSTGTPKATAVSHRSLTRLIDDSVLGLDTGTVSLVQAPPSWDAFALELWLPLAAGGRCILFGGTHLAGPDLRAAIEAGANTTFLTTSLLNALVDEDISTFAGLRQVATGGERASSDHLARCIERFPELRLVHLYGPVECTIAVTGAVLTPADLASGGSVTIGDPLSGSVIHLLDDTLADVEGTGQGQLAVSGDAVAHGYLGNEIETGARFRELPRRPGCALVRCYLTGDRGRRGADGRYEFIDRLDRQVKIRGNRIEPLEIEMAMEATHGVGSAVVFGHPVGAARFSHLVGAFVYSGDDEIEDSLRTALGERLPPAFVPDRLIRVGSPPTTANGKLDRRAMTAMAERMMSGTASTERTVSEPTRPAEASSPGVVEVLDHLEDLLGMRPDPQRDVFACGATSLTAIQLIGRLSQAGRRSLTAADLFRARTPVEIGELVDALAPTAPQSRVTENGPAEVFACTPARQQLPFWAQDRMGASSLTPLLLRLRGHIDIERLRHAIESVVTAHITLRTTYIDSSEGVRRFVVAPTDLPELLTVMPTASDPLAAIQPFLRRTFDLTTEIPFRAAVIGEGVDTALLACSFHHICFDAWSERVFCDDLASAYRSGCDLPFRDFASVAHAQDTADEPADLDATIAFWANRVNGIRPLSVRCGSPGQVEGPFSVIEIPIDGETTVAAHGIAARRSSSATTVFLAAFARAVTDVFGVGSAAIGVPAANRRALATHDVIGCLAETVLYGFRRDSPDAMLDQAIEQWDSALTLPPPDHDRLFATVRTPLVGWMGYTQIFFGIRDATTIRLPGGPSLEPIRVHNASGVAAIVVELWMADGVATLNYRPDTVDAETIQRLASAWRAETDILICDHSIRGARCESAS